MMNEKQAWKYLAKKWRNAKSGFYCWKVTFPNSNGLTEAYGICYCLTKLLVLGLISDNVYDSMKASVRQYQVKYKNCASAYLWPLDREGAKARYKFCLNRSRTRKKKEN